MGKARRRHRAGDRSASTALVAILVGAAAFRVAYLLQYRTASPFFDTPFFDSLTYDAWARRIAGGEWVGTEPFYFAPGYAYALAFVYRFVSASLSAVYV